MTAAGAVPVPVWCCPKCGAVCEVKHNPAYTTDDLTHYVEAIDHDSFLDFELRAAIRAGVAYGEHLRLTCTRCGWGGRTPVLPDPTPLDEPTPIYESMITELRPR